MRISDWSSYVCSSDLMDWYDRYLGRGSADRSANTSPGNKKGGLSNIVEKAMGSIIKSGSSPIVGVVSPGDLCETVGLNFAATPASALVSSEGRRVGNGCVSPWSFRRSP